MSYPFPGRHTCQRHVQVRPCNSEPGLKDAHRISASPPRSERSSRLRSEPAALRHPGQHRASVTAPAQRDWGPGEEGAHQRGAAFQLSTCDSAQALSSSTQPCRPARSLTPSRARPGIWPMQLDSVTPLALSPEHMTMPPCTKSVVRCRKASWPSSRYCRIQSSPSATAPTPTEASKLRTTSSSLTSLAPSSCSSSRRLSKWPTAPIVSFRIQRKRLGLVL